MAILRRIGLTEEESINESGWQFAFKSSHSYFHPKGNITSTHPTNDLDMSLIESLPFFTSQVHAKYSNCNQNQ